MNTIALTKISKFALIATISSALSFVAKHNSSFKAAFTFILIGITVTTLIACYWEGRKLISSMPSEEGLTDILGSLNGQKNKREFLLSPQVRLEIIIALLTILISSLIGSL